MTFAELEQAPRMRGHHAGSGFRIFDLEFGISDCDTHIPPTGPAEGRLVDW